MRVLLTAFEPYAEWSTNSSWMTLVEMLKGRPSNSLLVTRRYPVDLERMQSSLYKDLSTGFDAVLHLGQAPGASLVKLEAMAINAGGAIRDGAAGIDRLVSDAPEAYRSRMPLDRWAQRLNKAGIPAQISYHAGTYLCNAVMYLSHHWVAQSEQQIPVGFIHLPLASEQVAGSGQSIASLPLATLANALSLVLDDLGEVALA